MSIRGCQISTRPEQDDYIATVDGKQYRCHSIRGCFKAANGRWPKDLEETNRFIEICVHGKAKAKKRKEVVDEQ